MIGVIGCMAQRLGHNIKGVDFIIGPSNYRKLPQIIDIKQPTHICLENNKELYSDIFPEPDNKVTAFVSVMRGCSNFCSYCIVPYVRGKARSRPYKEILKEVKSLLSKNIKEITLLGQSVNQYQYEEVNFSQLLHLIAQTNLPWIKFTTSHPKNVTQELLNIMKEKESICEWLHLPVQAGSDKILKLMNRKYTKEEYLELIYKIKKIIPNISITTDIMVGFPGEETTDFYETLKLVKEVKFDFAYMFKYSDRPGTRAFTMKSKVPEQTKSKRLQELIDTQNRITWEKNYKLVSTTQEVLVIGKSRKSDAWFGKTRQNKTVVFEGKASPGDFVKVKIEGLRGWTPYGKKNSCTRLVF
jgi:tRNA-2-methylthio-N6-dimethylallyladenosine synthase